ncbi:MAG: GNAT family N-acetyltransferase [Pseudomonadota bacterium]
MQRATQRSGTKDDVLFLARMGYEASLPPFKESFWDDLIRPTGTETLAFLEELFRQDASNWGNSDDFIILELNGESSACCAVYRPLENPPSQGPLNLDKVPKIATTLGWSDTATNAFTAAYQKVWSGDRSFLTPQAEVIIETVAVVPSARGHGFGHRLMKAAFERGRTVGAKSIGIMAINGNDAAQSLYEKHFEPYATFHGAYFDHAFPGLTKYRASLA